MKNIIEQNNKGFSLVEILTALAISSVILLGVTAFMNGGSVSYRTATTQIALQDDVQETMNYLTDLLQRSMYVVVDNGRNVDTDTTKEKVLYMFMPKKDSLTGEYEVYYVIDDVNTGNVYVTNTVLPADGSGYDSGLTMSVSKGNAACVQSNLLTEGVTRFDADIEKDATSGEITLVNLRMNFRKNNKSREASIAVRPRNRDWVYDSTKPRFDSIINIVTP